MKKLLYEKDGSVYTKQDISLMPQIDQVIEKYPCFPYGYYVKSELLYMIGNSEYKKYAKKCIEILKITTTFEGHNEMQDATLKLLESKLINEK
jgi:hypothetical protein